MQSPIRAIMLLVFIAVPLLEIALLIKIGQAIGFWATILIVIATAGIGTWLLHQQGMDTLRRVLDTMDRGEPPIQPVLEGLVLIIAGFLLLTPGIITDSIGFTLLLPPVRDLVVNHVLRRLMVVTVTGRGQSHTEAEPLDKTPWTSPGRGRQDKRPEPPRYDGPVIEGEYERLDERPTNPDRPKR